MTDPAADLVRIRTRSDVICAMGVMLGFVPQDSIGFVCVDVADGRLGLVMRFDLLDIDDCDAFARQILLRLELEAATGVFVVVFDGSPPSDQWMPQEELTEALMHHLGPLVIDVLLASEDRWWSYLCDDECCGGQDGRPLDAGSAGIVALAARYALNGHGRLPDRAAVERSVALALDDGEADVMRARIERVLRQHRRLFQSARRRAITALTRRLVLEHADPREPVSDEDVALFAALSLDVVVRDEVVVQGTSPESRERLLLVLHQVVRRVPPPYDAPVCSMLGWISYAHGDGVVANVAIDRALRTDPAYAFALLTADALYRQVPPDLLEVVMRDADQEMRRPDSARWC